MCIGGEKMAKNYDFEIYGQPSHYDPEERKLKVYFSEPDKGINKKTGILLFIAGFGGHANSNVYKKMRSVFADKYNLVTIQCDYFGWEFMQGANQISLSYNKTELEKNFKPEEADYIYRDNNILDRLIEIASKYNMNISTRAVLSENLKNYNDMGTIQAIDNITAVISVMEIIKDNGFEFDRDKVIMYGNSHGSYLSYLCNAFAPSMFSMLIDNSSWLFPRYLKNNRYINSVHGNCVLSVEFDYLAKKLDYDEEILYLPSLYKKFTNKCNIICYHGTNDNLISHNDKFKLKQIIGEKFIYNEIDESKIDNKLFKSTQHGLDADFLELFDYTIKNHNFDLKDIINRKNENISYETKMNRYLVDYRGIVPVLELEKK